MGAKAEDARFESVEERCRANIVSDLLVGISDHADEELLGQKVRRTPVEMEVDATLILCGRILEIVGEAGDAGKFDTRRRVEVGISGAAVDAAVSDAYVG